MTKHNITWIDPMVPDEDDRCRYLRYKFVNGQLLRHLDVYTGTVLTTTYAFQEDEDVAPQVGDECLKIDYVVVSGVKQSITCSVVTVTQELIDDTVTQANLAPTDIALTNNTIPETTGIGETVGVLSTFDPNPTDTHTYTIVTDVDDKFEISGDLLRLKNLTDFDTSATHLVTIRSTDQGLLFFDKQFTIFITENIIFINDKATLFQGDTINMDMSGPASDSILPGNSSFTIAAYVKKDDPQPFNAKEMFLNGTTQFMDVASDPSFSGLSQFSFSSWVTPETLGGERTIISHFGAAGARGYRAYINTSGKLVFSFSQDGSSAETYIGTTTIATGARSNVSVAFDGTAQTLKSWVNGVLDINVSTTRTAIFNLTTQPLRIGARGDSGSPQVGFFHGLIDEVSIYNTALAQTNITAIYNSGDALDIETLPSSSGIISFWRMGDAVGDANPTIIDVVGSNNLTMNNMSTSNIVYVGGGAIGSGTMDNYALSFNATDERVDTTVDLSGKTKATISGWFYRAASTQRLDISQSDAANSQRIKLVVNGNGSVYAVLGGVNIQFIDAPTGWFHLAMTFDGSKTNVDRLQLIRDGVRLTGVSTPTIPTTIPSIPNTLTIGWDRGANKYSDGLIDEVSIWDKALTLTEVIEVYNAGVPELLSTHSAFADLLNWYRMGDLLSGSTVPDQAGSDDGTLVNMDNSNKTLGIPMVSSNIEVYKPVIDLGNLSLEYNQTTKFRVNYLDNTTPMELITENNDYSDGNYHHIVVEYSSTSHDLLIYADGVQVAIENSVVIPARTSQICRIAGNIGQSNFLDATVDEIALYNLEVNVAELYNNGYSQDLFNHDTLPAPRLWLRMGDPPDDFINVTGILDRSGNNFHFTANNMSISNCINDGVLAEPVYENTLSLPFNGIDQYGDTGINTDLTGSGDFSISVWYKGTSPSYIVSQAHTLGSYSSDFIIGGGGAVFWVRTQTIGALGSISDDQWHHIVMSWNSGTSTYDGYVDGVNIGTSSTVVGFGGTGTVSVSTRGDFTTSFNQGKVDELSFFNKSLDDTEVIELYNAGIPTDLDSYSAAINVTNWYRMGEDDADDETTIIDQKGSSDITLTNFLANPYDSDVPS